MKKTLKEQKKTGRTEQHFVIKSQDLSPHIKDKTVPNKLKKFPK